MIRVLFCVSFCARLSGRRWHDWHNFTLAAAFRCAFPRRVRSHGSRRISFAFTLGQPHNANFIDFIADSANLRVNCTADRAAIPLVRNGHCHRRNDRHLCNELRLRGETFANVKKRVVFSFRAAIQSRGKACHWQSMFRYNIQQSTAQC